MGVAAAADAAKSSAAPEAAAEIATTVDLDRFMPCPLIHRPELGVH
jgi:hypothetical protein